jgi:hypothetical protein
VAGSCRLLHGTDRNRCNRNRLQRYRQTVTGTDQGHAAFEDAVGQHRKLIRLAVGEGSQVFSVLFLGKYGRSGSLGLERLLGDLAMILLGDTGP